MKSSLVWKALRVPVGPPVLQAVSMGVVSRSPGQWPRVREELQGYPWKWQVR